MVQMDINNELVLLEPIIFHGITIYQPTIREILKYGINEYNELLIPYSVTLDMLGIDEEQIQNLKVFDIISYEKQLFKYLLLSLQVFCKTSNIEPIYYGEILGGIKINNNLLNRDDFDEFSDIILKIHAREKAKQDKLPENKRQREIELTLRANRAKLKSKNEFQLCDIINIVKYGGKYHITTNEIKDMTLWELTNAYSCKLGVSNYEDSLSIALVCGDKDNSLDGKHWSNQLKVGK
jgi:hypothetical protein